ncbi:hypothetical protein AB0M39_11710 [Streptomyces sp. NPDC051907]
MAEPLADELSDWLRALLHTGVLLADRDRDRNPDRDIDAHRPPPS